MRWSLLVAVFGLSITDVASLAQRPLDGQRPVSMRWAYQDAGFFASTGVVRFQLIQGRLSLDSPRHRKGSQNRDEENIYESITVTAERGIPSMHYVCQTPNHHLTLSVQQADSLRIESWFPQASERSVLEQPAVGAITWTQKRGDIEEDYVGSTLLHLRQLNPVDFDVHFGRLIKRLLRGQSLNSLSEETRYELIGQLADSQLPSGAAIQECVDQLKSKQRARRVAAERRLLSWGTPIVPVLGRLPASDLDAEQTHRLRRILKRLRPPVDDTPATLAKLLVNDAEYWSRISHQLSSAQLQLANTHLVRFGANKIDLSSEPEERVAATDEPINR